MAIHEGNTKDISLENVKFKIFAYGSPGSGKTYFGSTMPKPFFIALDRGLSGLSVRKQAVPFVRVDTYDDVMSVLTQIRNGQRASECESLVLDHLSALTPLVIEKVLADARKQVMDIGLWGVAKDKLRVLVKEFTELADSPSVKKNFHIAMLSHETVEKNELRGGIYGVPDTIGQFAYSIGGWFDLFLYFEQDVRWEAGKQIPTWKMHSVKHVDFNAKDRLGILSPSEDNEFAVILKRYKEKTDASN